jgi:hypothetical protein
MIGRFFIITFLSAMSLYGVTNQELFLQANDAVKKNDFDQAYGLYDAIDPKGEAVWYNMGLCALAEKNYYNALRMFASARRYATFNSYPLIMEHYYQARHALGVPNDISALQKISMKCTQCSLLMPLIGWQLIAWCLWLFLILCMTVCKRRRIGASLIVLPLLVFTLSMIFFQYRLINTVYIVIKNPVVKAFIGPDEGFSSSFVLKQADEVPLVETHKGWYKVHKGSNVGWIRSDMGDVI